MRERDTDRDGEKASKEVSERDCRQKERER